MSIPDRIAQDITREAALHDRDLYAAYLRGEVPSPIDGTYYVKPKANLLPAIVDTFGRVEYLGKPLADGLMDVTDVERVQAWIDRRAGHVPPEEPEMPVSGPQRRSEPIPGQLGLVGPA